MNPVRAFLRRHRRIALDTSVFVYQLQADPRFVAFTDAIFEWVERPRHKAVTPTVTMTALLAPAYGQPTADGEMSEERVDEFFALLSTYPNLDWISLDLEIATIAAELRARHQLRPQAALVAATAVRQQATGLVTDDPAVERVKAFETLVLSHLPTGGTEGAEASHPPDVDAAQIV